MQSKEGSVTYQGGAAPELPVNPPQPLDYGDSLRTLRLSSASVKFQDLSGIRIVNSRASDYPARGARQRRLGEVIGRRALRGRPRSGALSLVVETPAGTKVIWRTEFLIRFDPAPTRQC
jgi:hypothetical protein